MDMISNPRHFVIELSIIIEEIISKTLGLLLKIDWKDSATIGYKSTALSFNQKIQIIQDIRGIDKSMIKKLNSLMVIRNKFAHIGEITSFEKLFTLDSCLEIKKNLQKWYSKPEDSTDNTEDLHYEYFNRLISDIIEFLTKMGKDYAYETGYKNGLNDYYCKAYEELISELKHTEEGRNIIDKVIAKIESEFEKDKEKK